MLSTPSSHLVIRNYLMAIATVMLVSVGMADTFNSPSRIAQQDRLDSYGRYLSAGLVTYAKTWGR
jgi:hypothetical protein